MSQWLLLSPIQRVGHDGTKQLVSNENILICGEWVMLHYIGSAWKMNVIPTNTWIGFWHLIIVWANWSDIRININKLERQMELTIIIY